VKTETQQYALGKTSAIDSSVYQTILPYSQKVNSIMDSVIGQSETAMEKRQPESKLGDFVTDAILYEANKICNTNNQPKVDFAFVNNGGLRSALPFGDITVGNIFSLMPFENEMTVLTLNGITTKQLVEFIIDKGGIPVSNIKIVIQNKKAIEVKINGADFDSTKTYRVVTSDYLANGGDKLTFLSQALNKENLNMKLRDALLIRIKEITASGKKINPKIEGRITYEQ
jgi:2',3'-cyclic-nucleotide 2'-phosphodiesterase (5'-nucleotidase family)